MKEYGGSESNKYRDDETGFYCNIFIIIISCN